MGSKCSGVGQRLSWYLILDAQESGASDFGRQGCANPGFYKGVMSTAAWHIVSGAWNRACYLSKTPLVLSFIANLRPVPRVSFLWKGEGKMDIRRRPYPGIAHHG
jgi:hypothetical protein